MSYEEKYLKYKRKYLNLKADNINQLGGGGEKRYIVILLPKDAKSDQLKNLSKIYTGTKVNKEGFMEGDSYDFVSGKFKEIMKISPYIEFKKDETNKKLSSVVIHDDNKEKPYTDIKNICDNNKDTITELLNTDPNNTEPYLYTCLNIPDNNEFRTQVVSACNRNNLVTILKNKLPNHYFVFMAVIINSWASSDNMVYYKTNIDREVSISKDYIPRNNMSANATDLFTR